MSDFYTDSVTRVARNPTRCTYCAEPIAKGEHYTHQKGRYDGRWFESKMHPECFDEMCELDEDEYMPYSNERPVAQGERNAD